MYASIVKVIWKNAFQKGISTTKTTTADTFLYKTKQRDIEITFMTLQ